MNIIKTFAIAVMALFALTVSAVAEPVKVGFVYVGPIGNSLDGHALHIGRPNR